MEMWMNSHLLAQIILQERLQERKREPIVLNTFNVNFDWLQPIVKGLVGLFL